MNLEAAFGIRLPVVRRGGGRPLIRRSRGDPNVWACSCLNYVGFGLTPKLAYEAWKNAAA